MSNAWHESRALHGESEAQEGQQIAALRYWPVTKPAFAPISSVFDARNSAHLRRDCSAPRGFPRYRERCPRSPVFGVPRLAFGPAWKSVTCAIGTVGSGCSFRGLFAGTELLEFQPE